MYVCMYVCVLLVVRGRQEWDFVCVGVVVVVVGAAVQKQEER